MLNAVNQFMNDEKSYKSLFIKFTLFGLGLAAVSVSASYVLSLFFPDIVDKVAGKTLFRESSTLQLIFVLLIWAPAFETVLGQFIPITIIRFITKSNTSAIVCSALTYSLGHMLGGGGIAQGVMTALMGGVFAWLYLAYMESGKFVTVVMIAWTHSLHNAVLLCVSIMIS